MVNQRDRRDTIKTFCVLGDAACCVETDLQTKEVNQAKYLL